MEARLGRTVMVSVFDSSVQAKEAIRLLRDARFAEKDIGVLTRDQEGQPVLRSFRELEGNHAVEGAAIGTATGAGGGALWALGVAAGVLPAIGPVVAGGLLVAVLASAAVGAGTGVILGSLVGLGVRDEDAAYFDGEFRKGRTIVVVEAADRADLARALLLTSGGRFRTVAPGSVAQQIEGAVRT